MENTGLLTVNALHREVGFDRRTWARWLESVEPRGMKGRARLYAWPDIARALGAQVIALTPAAGAGPQVQSLAKERAALAREQRDRVALENAVTRGELVRADHVVKGFSVLVLAARDRLRGVPSAASRRLKLTKPQVIELGALIDDALRDLAAGEGEEAV